jgi:hypothetical protein
MSEGSLFNSGFLGASFSWWIGQIAEDSTWRDNILPGKFESVDEVPGWGRRYKVRIIGLHDQGETEIPSDQLPWAQVMYPVTGGGGQAKSGQTPNLRQGNMVFGFFLDGQDQQVPVIMGVLGNNAQTTLATKIGDSRVTNTQPGSLATSGYAEPTIGSKDTNIKAPDEGLVIKKPTSLSTPVPSPQQLQNLEVAVPGATIENVDAVHLQSNADTKRLDLYLKKTVMLSPCDLPGSAMKAMQTDIDTLTKEVEKILQSTQSYVDAVSQIGGIGTDLGTSVEQIQKLVKKFVPKISKYMKIVFNKILEFVTKKVNSVLSPLADVMYPNQRFQFFDIKIEITEEVKCLFIKITENLPKQIEGTLKKLLLGENEDTPQSTPSEDPTQGNLNPLNPKGGGTTPFVPICFVEDLTGSIIQKNKGLVNGTVAKITKSIGNFLSDIQEGQIESAEQLFNQDPKEETLADREDEILDLEDIEGLLGSFVEGLGNIEIPDIAATIVSAFSFENISMDIFGCDLKPNCPVSDFYTLQEGAGAAEEAQLPRPAEVALAAQSPPRIPVFREPTIDFGKPSKDTPPLRPPLQEYPPEQFFPQSLLDNRFTQEK